jgi:4-amino-4-deoxy-L-arabinose transferase-like glycosyltransferase
MTARTPPATFPLWLPVWLAVAGISIFLHGPVPLYSTRTLTVAWEMWQLGEWLLPHQNGLPYSHKAPLLYWLIHAGWAIGGVSDVWPRLLMVLLGAANLALVARLARQLLPLRPLMTRLAPWALMGLLYWFLFALQIMFDLLVSACVLLALAGLTRRDATGHFAPHWLSVVAGLALGLLAKGPVALLHLAFPLLFGPWWNTRAATAPGRWYAAAAGSVIAALALFALWVVPVAILGGEAYRHELLVQQTAGRVVSAFDHARPPWWYLSIAPLLLFPWIAWPTAWRSLRIPGALAEPGMRLLAAWLLPSLAAFSLVSGKQGYYLLPQLAGFALWLAASVALREHHGDRRGTPRAPGSVLLLAGIAIAALPRALDAGWIDTVFVAEFAAAGAQFGLAVAGLGLLLLVGGAREASRALPRIALATLLATALLHAQFTRSVWSRYDLQPAAEVLAAHARQGTLIANRGTYEGQFNFLARLTAPVVELDYDDGPPWAARHPDAIVVDYVDSSAPRVPPPGQPVPLWSGPFRSDTLQIWRAGDWLAARSRPAAAPRPSSG